MLKKPRWIGTLTGALLLTATLASGAVLAETVKIGFHAPLTGPAAVDGNSALQGAKLAVADANAKGGINAKEVELVVYDDQASPKEAVPIATKLIEKDQVVAAVSGSYSGATRAAAGLFQAARIPYISAYAVHPEITQAGDYVFRTATGGEQLGAAGAQLIGEKLGKKKVVLITLQNDFGQSMAAGFKLVAARYGIDIVNEYQYGIKDRQFGPIVSKVKADQPEAIYASGYFFTAGPLISQLRAGGVEAPVIGQEGYDSEKFMEIAGKAAEGVIITTSLDRDSDKAVTRDFIANFQKQAGFKADMVAASAYSALSVMITAMRQAGADAADRPAIRDAIAKGSFETPIGQLTFSEQREVRKDIQVQVVKDGDFHRHSVLPAAELPSLAAQQ
ncbi:MAG TPA: ABC transporter substrate-binding protein [Candidatus Competibacteraceae bacterium]|nr:ABC transporter substrate-binding protein [Candidatus Competibacteraceae bacterium]